MPSFNTHTFVGPDGEPRHRRIDRAIAYLIRHHHRQPSLDDIAKAAGLSPYHLQRTFKTWTGVTPKRFMQYLQLGQAKELLIRDRALLDTALDVGLSGTGRLHDLFIHCEAVTPGQFKTRGRGLTISYGLHDSAFGRALLATTPRGLCWLGFVSAGGDRQALAELRGDWPEANLVADPQRTRPYAERAFARARAGGLAPTLSLDLRGTNFQIKVWEALLRIPFGQLATYQDVAAAVGQPSAARAVGSAVGANPISLVIPCHRVILKSGVIHNYRWGTDRKRTILVLEQALNSSIGEP